MLAGDQHPDEDGPGVLHEIEQRQALLLGHHELEVLGSDRLATASALSGPWTRQAIPGRGRVASRSARRVEAATMRSTSAEISSARTASHVTSQESPSGPCSAWTTKSMAAKSWGAPGPATTTISEGPAKAEATPTTP